MAGSILSTAQAEQPEAVADVLQQIAALYRIETTIRSKGLTDAQKHQCRLEHSQPIVDGFFDWCRAQLDHGGLVPILLGKKHWIFHWAELGAEHVGIVQSLIATCKLHGINPYTYLVDVLQRVGQHPARDVVDLTPRRWKARFADNPLRSDVDRIYRRHADAPAAPVSVPGPLGRGL